MRGRFFTLLFGTLLIIIGGWLKAQSIQSIPLHATLTTEQEELIVEPEQGVNPLLSAIKSAHTSVDLVMYELDDTEVERALAEASARHVSVRVILNNQFGKNHGNVNQDAYSYLESHQVPVHWSSLHVAITHQKTVLIDKTRAYILTFNFRPKYYSTGRDFGIIDVNQYDTADIESVFQQDWDDAPATVPTNENLVWSPNAQDAFITAIAGAQKSITIYAEEMGYRDIVSALEDASSRGVEVRILMTQSDRWQKALDPLSSSGAQVRLFVENAKLYIHAKVLIVDDTSMILGSQNYSYYSMRKNRELSIISHDTNLISEVRKIFESDWISATR